MQANFVFRSCLLGSAFCCVALGLMPRRLLSQDAPAPPATDVLVFTNGDQLRGKLEKAVGDTITFKSDMAGELTVPLAKIKELRTSSNFAVLRKDQKITNVPAVLGTVSVADGTLSIARSQQQVETIPTAELAYVVSAPDYTRALTNIHSPFANWNGSLTGGASIVRATQNSTTLTVGANLVRLAPGVPYLPPHSRSTVNIAESFGKLSTPFFPQTNPRTADSVIKTNIFHADAEYDRYFSRRLYALADLAFDHNFSQGLQLQQIYGGGLGYTVFERPVEQLDVKGEIHYEKQQFIQTPGVITPDNNLIGASLGESYRRNLPYKVVFTEIGTFIPAFNNTNAYSANILGALAIPTYKRLSIAISASDDYLNNPPVGFRQNSFQFITGVTYTLH